MEHGDLAVSVRPSYVFVLEGVLATVTPIISETRWRRRPQVTGYNIGYHDLALRRIWTMKQRYPDVGIDIITFLNETVAEDAAQYLNDLRIPYDSIGSASLDRWVRALPYREGTLAVYDSDPNRLDRYGQLGRSVIRGEDF